jgi:thiamine pyrophosphokinase
VSDRDGRLVVVVAGGDPVPPAAVADLPAGVPVVAADSGVDHAAALGLTVTEAVGDFDSVTPAGLRAAEARGAAVDRHPAAKDETDLELALDRALALGADRVIVVGGHGGRTDHFLANALLLTAERYATVALEARFGPAVVHVLRGGPTAAVSLLGLPGDLVSLLAVDGPAAGVTTTGLAYPLDDGTLHPGRTRGVSNELTGTEATVRLQAGLLLVVQPHAYPPAATTPVGDPLRPAPD